MLLNIYSANLQILHKARVKNDYRNSNPEVAISSIENVFDYDEMKKLPN